MTLTDFGREEKIGGEERMKMMMTSESWCSERMAKVCLSGPVVFVLAVTHGPLIDRVCASR